MSRPPHASSEVVGAAIPLREPLSAADLSRPRQAEAPAARQESGVFAARRAVTPGVSDEEQLIARAVAGDTASFKTLYTRHRADVARLVYRMIGGQADVDDVIQEVFFQVFRSLKDFRGQSKFTTWLHRVTVNVVLMHRRAARSRPVFADEPPNELALDPAAVSPDEGAARRERMRAFAR